jgi:hypothetical protein
VINSDGITLSFIYQNLIKSPMDRKGRIFIGRGFVVGVGLTSLATLMLQVSLTRIFSVSLWHHFAFMVVSTSFLGYGASGTFLMIAPKGRGFHLGPTVAKAAFALSVVTLMSYWGSNMIPFDPARLVWDRYQWFYLLAYYGLLATPFFFSGLILVLVYASQPEDVGRIYAWDLLGAGLGCMGILWFYSCVGETGAVLIVALIAVAASLAFAANGWKFNLVRGIWTAVLCLIIATRPELAALNISPYKALMVALRYPGARILETRWDSMSRLDIIESGAVRFAPGLSLEFRGRLPEQLGLCLDAGRLNAATHFKGNRADLTFTEFLPASLPYRLTEPGCVLVMEPLGGLDILTALYHGAKNIVTTHSSSLTLRAMRTFLGDFSGHVYENHATPVEEQARSFLLRSPLSFDVIQLPLTDSSGAVSSGLYGLSEDYSLTVEAFKTYLDALKPHGFLTVTQYLLPPPRHEIRLLGLACAALESRGVTAPERHIGAIRSWGAFTLVVKKSPLEPQEIHQMKGFCRRLRFDLVHYPNMPREEANIYNRFPSPLYYDMAKKVLSARDKETFYEDYIFDVKPVTDDRPFFYHNFRMDHIVPLYRAVGNKWQLFLEGGYLVYLIFFQALAVSLVLIVLPLKKTGLPSSWWFLVYFGLIGIAFMLTEICLIQRFILFLARPAYAFSIVLFSMLFASALGSHCSRKLKGRLPTLVLTPLLVIAYALCLDGLLSLAMPWPLWIRYGATFLLLLPLGFMMGTYFPLGIQTLSRRFERAIPWAWSVNGCASVTGSVLAMVIAVSYGFTAVLCLAALAYGLAFVVLLLQNLAHHGNKYDSQ